MFLDASELGYGAAVRGRWDRDNCSYDVRTMLSKAENAPLKSALISCFALSGQDRTNSWMVF